MANQNQTDSNESSIEQLNDTLSNIEQKVQNNQKLFAWICMGVAIIMVLILVYIYAIRKPGIAASNDAIGQADMALALGNDSIALNQYKQVADSYGYDAGNRAALNAAIILYREGKYQEAIDYLAKYNSSETLIGASSKSLEGDCYVNLKQYDKAISAFADAARISDNNPHYTPIFLMKEATVQRELKNYSAEAKLYKEIKDKYPTFATSMNIDIEKYLKRAQADEGK